MLPLDKSTAPQGRRRSLKAGMKRLPTSLARGSNFAASSGWFSYFLNDDKIGIINNYLPFAIKKISCRKKIVAKNKSEEVRRRESERH